MSLFDNLRSAGSLPVEGHLPGFDGATGWLNSSLTAPDLQGKVVLAEHDDYGITRVEGRGAWDAAGCVPGSARDH